MVSVVISSVLCLGERLTGKGQCRGRVGKSVSVRVENNIDERVKEI